MYKKASRKTFVRKSLVQNVGEIDSCWTVFSLGSRHTSGFDRQYSDKKIKQYFDKTIFFFRQNNAVAFQNLLKT